MSWKYERARERIKQHIGRAPDIIGDTNSLSEHRKAARLDLRAAYARGEFPRSRAVIIEGVHLFGYLLDFERFIGGHLGPESEQHHIKMLSFLDGHYAIWESLVSDGGGFTVDFHGPRLHAVLAEKGLSPSEQIERAMALAARLSEAAREAGRALGIESRTRFGIDYGPCVALTTGRSLETDTLFLGRPANHAAKIAAEADVEGIYLAPAAQHHVQADVPFGPYGASRALESLVIEASERYRFDALDAAVKSIVDGAYRPPRFTFYRPQPPLASLKFANLKPSKTARLGTSSLFADIDGYTAYIDDAIGEGHERVKEATTALHVIREELNDVLRQDFGGKRVRFIGDCIHGLLAEGQTSDDPEVAIEQSLYCASGMRSSFSLVQTMLGNLDAIDLAVGVEYGPVSISRIGNRGDASFRCAAGSAVIISERAQQEIDGGGIRLGQTAASVAPSSYDANFVNAGRIPEYDDALNLFGSMAAPAIQIVRDDPSARPYCSGENT